jgi:ABC-type phosphate transport system permease subunit
MPYASGKFKGQLKSNELRELVAAHNRLTDIKIPKKATRQQIIKIINDKGFNIDHKNKKLKPKTKRKPKPKKQEGVVKKLVGTTGQAAATTVAGHVGRALGTYLTSGGRRF